MSVANANDFSSSEDGPEVKITKPRPKRHGKTWTQEEKDLLFQQIEEGMTFAEIAKDHERTPTAIKLYILKYVSGKVSSKEITLQEATEKFHVSEDDIVIFKEQEETRKANAQMAKEFKKAVKTIDIEEVMKKFSMTKEEVISFKEKENIKKSYQKAKKSAKKEPKGKGRWSKEDDEILLEKVSDKVPVTVIANELCRKTQSVDKRVRILLERKILSNELSCHDCYIKYGRIVDSVIEENEKFREKLTELNCLLKDLFLK